jgi:hypothetical protein
LTLENYTADLRGLKSLKNVSKQLKHTLSPLPPRPSSQTHTLPLIPSRLVDEDKLSYHHKLNSLNNLFLVNYKQGMLGYVS